MRANATYLTEFLNQGLLPFTGREEELVRLKSFWRETINASSLRSMLLIGEAGIGKSRLVEQLIPTIKASGGVLLHLRFRPESTLSPVWLLTDVARRTPHVQPLLRVEPEPTLGSLVDTLRRLCRLRLTMIIVEDIHLLEGDSLSEFAMLLRALSEDPIALLLAARPINEKVRSVCALSLIGEITLGGLNEGEIKRMVDQLMGGTTEVRAAAVLHEATWGNPLALRGALRGALNREAIHLNDGEGWRVDESFSTIVLQSVDSISDGLATHLTDEERSAAVQLSSLGELFSRTTARRMLGEDVDTLIDRLHFKGMFVQSLSGIHPLFGADSLTELPSSFTHSLVHSRFLDEVEVDPLSLFRVICADLPLYSILPFQTLQEFVENDKGGAVRELEQEEMEEGIQRLIEAAMRLNKGTEWQFALPLLQLAETLYRKYDRWDKEKERSLELLYLSYRLQLLERDIPSDEFRLCVEQMMEKTASDLPESLIEYRLIGLIYRYYELRLRDKTALLGLEREIERLAEEFPSLKTTSTWISYLRPMRETSHKEMRRKEKMVLELLERDDLSEEIRNALQRQAVRGFLQLCSTPEELKMRLKGIEEVDRAGIFNDLSWIIHKLIFYIRIGEFRRGLPLIPKAKRLAQRTGRGLSIVSTSLFEIECEVAMGFPLEKAMVRLKQLIEKWHSEFGELPTLFLHFANSAALYLDFDWLREWSRVEGVKGKLPQIVRLLMILQEENPHEQIARLPKDDRFFVVLDDYQLCFRLFAGDYSEATVKGGRQLFDDMFAGECISIHDALNVYVMLFSLDVIETDHLWSSKELQSMMHHGLTSVLKWLMEKELPLQMQVALDRFSTILQKKEQKKWTQRVNGLIAEQAALRQKESNEHKFRLRMFGRIELSEDSEMEGKEPVRPKGERMRVLLGAMVANEILRKPLSREKFLALATGGADDPTRARDIVNITVFRLRKEFGDNDVIVTDGSVPRLNTDLISIDLLEADRMIGEATEALAKQSLMRAVPTTLQALELWSGDVPFPTLYSDYFEELRDRFEANIRSTTMGVVQELLREEDHAEARRLLERLHEFMPEDEEILEVWNEVE